MQIYCLQHVNFEAPGNILKWAKERKHPLKTILAYQAPVFPNPSEFDLLIIMGGPMGVSDTDQYPWLLNEKKFLRDTLQAGKKIVGVCLGAQLVAETLGGNVKRNAHKEIGYHPISITEAGKKSPLLEPFPSPLSVFHWHGEIFEAPPEAETLAESAITPSQLFIWKNQALGIQFHPEVCATTLESMIKNCKADLEVGPWIQTVPEMKKNVASDQISYALLCHLLDTFLIA